MNSRGTSTWPPRGNRHGRCRGGRACRSNRSGPRIPPAGGGAVRLGHPQPFPGHTGVQALLDLLSAPGLGRRIEALAGYDVSGMGAPVHWIKFLTGSGLWGLMAWVYPQFRVSDLLRPRPADGSGSPAPGLIEEEVMALVRCIRKWGWVWMSRQGLYQRGQACCVRRYPSQQPGISAYDRQDRR